MAEKLIPLAIVLERTGFISTTTIWRMRRAKQFPEPVAVSPNRKAWRESEIDAWLKARVAGQFNQGSNRERCRLPDGTRDAKRRRIGRGYRA